MELLDDLRLHLAETFGFVSPRVAVLARAADDSALTALAARIRAAEERKEEGFVITYAGGAMAKCKSQYYADVKAFRAQLSRRADGRPIRASGPGTRLMRAFLDRGDAEDLLERFTLDGLLGPVIDVPALVAAL